MVLEIHARMGCHLKLLSRFNWHVLGLEIENEKRKTRFFNYADSLEMRKKKIGEEIQEEGQGLIKRGVFFSVGV